MRTERLEIEILTPQHAEILFEPLRDERIYRFMPERPFASVEALRARYQRLVAGPAPEEGERWLNWVMLRASDRCPVGTLQSTLYPSARRADVAYVVFPEHWRRGYGAEGLRWLLEYLASTKEVDCAAAQIDTHNVASRALIERAGFVLRGFEPTPEGEDALYERSI